MTVGVSESSDTLTGIEAGRGRRRFRVLVCVGLFSLAVLLLVSACASPKPTQTDEIDGLIAELGKAIGSEDTPAAANQLVEIGEPAIGPLIAAYKDESAFLWAERVVAMIGAPAVEPLIAALKDKDARVRGSAASTLSQIGDKRAVEPLIALLQDSDETSVHGATVREIAAYALGEMGDTRAVEPLISALKDKVPSFRYNAAIALEALGDKRAVAPLRAASKSEQDELARDQMVAAVKTLTGEKDAEEEPSGNVPSDFPRYSKETAGEDAFSTTDGVKQVASFYQRKLKATGWEIEPGMVVEEQGGGMQSALVAAQRGAESVTVTVTRQPGQDTQVIIMYLN